MKNSYITLLFLSFLFLAASCGEPIVVDHANYRRKSIPALDASKLGISMLGEAWEAKLVALEKIEDGLQKKQLKKIEQLEKKLGLTKDHKCGSVKRFKNNLEQLNDASRAFILEIFTICQSDPYYELRFFKVVISLSRQDQARLMDILITLAKQDDKKKELLFKMLDPSKKLGPLEKAELGFFVKRLKDTDEKLMMQFKNHLDE